MRTFVVPARYASEIEAVIIRTVDQVRLDIHRRELGERPLIPDFGIDEHKSGDVFVIVGVAGDSLAAGIEHLRTSREKAKENRPRKARKVAGGARR